MARRPENQLRHRDVPAAVRPGYDRAKLRRSAERAVAPVDRARRAANEALVKAQQAEERERVKRRG